MIYFIIGASGSGKTVSLEPLKNLLPEFTLYDFDDIGVPDNADKKWRQEATEEWIKKLSSGSRLNDICLLGQMVPAEIVSSPSATNLDEIHIILLDCSDEVRVQRLRKRNTYGINQNTLNWAAWLRMHCKDPTWEPDVIKESSSSHMLFSQWSQLVNWPKHVKISSIDTSFLTINQTAHSITHIIKPTVKMIQNINFEISFSEASLLDLDKVIHLLADDPIGVSREKLDEISATDYLHAFTRINSDENSKIIIGSYMNKIIAVAQINFIQNLTYQGGIRAQIEGVRVHKDYQSKGVGKALFEYLISLSRERSCHMVQLTTDKSRENAFKFYKTLGFINSHEGFKLNIK